MSITTKRGDHGQTDTLDGRRIAKDNRIISLLGSLDELTSLLGLARLSLGPKEAASIKAIQSLLVPLMGSISTAFKTKIPVETVTITLEEDIKAYEQVLPKMTGFVLPGDGEASARLHVARTCARAIEREMVAMTRLYTIPKTYLALFNRLSDYLYAMACYEANRGVEGRVSEPVKSSLQDPYMIPTESMVSPSTTKNVMLLTKEVTLTLDMAKLISEAVEIKAKAEGAKVVICLVSKEGIPILIHRMDQAFPLSFDLAKKKAYTAATLNMSTEAVGHLIKEGGSFEGLESMVSEPIVGLGGGFPLSVLGQPVGGIGVSGSTVTMDQDLATYGVLFFETIIKKLQEE